ncbi:MAG TPA: molybdenum ABC transporter ATP-binding protein [Rhodocyclaceae bacterium]|nr:molybdenum ABC transporter ATP-binding protein [Rhodocyclaceae bacterium]
MPSHAVSKPIHSRPAVSDERLIAQLSVQHADFVLQLALDVPARGVTAIFGRSGSGKTTALRAIAGLHRPASARIAIGSELWQDDAKGIFVPVHQRALGYVFQEASLFAHLDVRANMAYGMKRVPAALRRVSWEQAVDWLGVGALLDRKPDQLSGGERQRVAIARALLTSPRLLLMDEPLAALDALSKEAILPYLERLHRELDIPVLYVSHAIDEVARLADHIVLLDAGQVMAAGPLQEVLTRLDLQTAFSDDMGAVIDAEVIERDEAYSLSRIAFPGGDLLVGGLERPIGTAVRARLLARDVSIAVDVPGASSILNVLPATVLEIGDAGADKVNVRLLLQAAGQGEALKNNAVLISRITRRSRDLLALQVGQHVFAQVKSVALLT